MANNTPRHIERFEGHPTVDPRVRDRVTSVKLDEAILDPTDPLAVQEYVGGVNADPEGGSLAVHEQDSPNDVSGDEPAEAINPHDLRGGPPPNPHVHAQPESEDEEPAEDE